MAAVDGAVKDFNNRFDKLKYDALAALAPTFEKVATAMGKAVTALDEFLQTEEGQQVLSSLNDALSGIIDSFLGEGGTDFSGIVNAAKGAVEGLTSALNWIA